MLEFLNSAATSMFLNLTFVVVFSSSNLTAETPLASPSLSLAFCFGLLPFAPA